MRSIVFAVLALVVGLWLGSWSASMPTDNAVVSAAELPVCATVTPTATVPPVPTATPGAYWVPPANVSWHWMIGGPLNLSNPKHMGLAAPDGTLLTSPPPTVYDIDLEENSASVVSALHQQGKHVICYINVGTFENWRADAASFPASVKGKKVDGWAGENWLDVRQTEVLLPIMQARMEKCKVKGFDSVEPDNMDGWSNNTGFPITGQQQIAYNRALAVIAHNLGLSIAMKNDLEQVAELVDDFDYAIVEECARYNECNLLNPFLARGKAVLQAEYTGNLNSFCPAANAANRNAVKFNLNLNSGRQPCR
jgi:hypothetical protein